LIKTDTTECLIESLEVEQRGYRHFLNTLAVHKKIADCTWLCVGISPLLYGLRAWSKRQTTRGKSCSLHSQKIFCLGVRFFCQWRHKWRTFRPPWPTLLGPGRQPL